MLRAHAMDAALSMLDALPENHHVVVAILGLAPDETARLYRSPHWEALCRTLDPLVSSYPWGRFTSLLARVEKLGAPRADGTQRVTFHRVPGLKSRAWNQKNLAAVSAHFAADDAALKHQETFVTAAPAQNAASLWDVYFALNTIARSAASRWDQQLRLALSATAVRTVGRAALQNTIESLASLAHAVRVGVTSRPWQVKTAGPIAGVTYADNLIDARVSIAYDNADLQPNPHAPWVLLR